MELHPKPSRELGRFNSCPHLYRRRGKQNIRRLSMDNELRDIANKLEGYNERGWMATSAQRNADGSWDLHIIRYAKPLKKEDADDDDK
jgi:hypothetical protein